jgi:hypothetical protein
MGVVLDGEKMHTLAKEKGGGFHMGISYSSIKVNGVRSEKRGCGSGRRGIVLTGGHWVGRHTCSYCPEWKRNPESE